MPFYALGTKTTTTMIGLTGNVKVKDCGPYDEKDKIETVLEAAMKAGKATGIVTTARLTHASPAAAYAHTAYRDWECDK